MQVGAMAGGNLAKKREKMAKMHLHLKKKEDNKVQPVYRKVELAQQHVWVPIQGIDVS